MSLPFIWKVHDSFPHNSSMNCTAPHSSTVTQLLFRLQWQTDDWGENAWGDQRASLGLSIQKGQSLEDGPFAGILLQTQCTLPKPDNISVLSLEMESHKSENWGDDTWTLVVRGRIWNYIIFTSGSVFCLCPWTPACRGPGVPCRNEKAMVE